MRQALFLDRDGVVNIDMGYVYLKENFIFIDGVFSLVKVAREAGYLVIIVTNQAGIGRGYYTEEQFHALMQWVKNEFRQHKGDIDAIYYCPDHPVHGIGKYKRDSDMRKPGSGMILLATHEHDIDLANSVLIGDSDKDIQAGYNAGIGMLFYIGTKCCPAIAKKISRLDEAERFFKFHNA